MSSSDLDRLRFLRRALQRPAPATEVERQALETFRRLCRAGRDRRKRDRRHRAFLVETDRRSGFDRRAGERRAD